MSAIAHPAVFGSAALREEMLAALRSDVMHLTIMPTEKCNFRCVYCYEDFVHGGMSRQNVSAIKKLLAARWADLKHLTISWFGGEPLNAVRTVYDLMAYVRRARPAHCAVDSGMTTNAFRLGRETLEKLIALGVTSYQVTLDGGREDHDARRLQANGRGSFDVIWRNLLDARGSPLDFEIMLRVHVDRHTLPRLRSFVAQLADAFAYDSRFKVFLRPISRLGGPNDARIAILDPSEREEVREIRSQLGAAGLTGVVRDESCICYAAKPNSLVIRSDGSLAKCTVAFDLDKNKVGRLNADGTLTFDVAKVRSWAEVLNSPNSEDLRCPLPSVARG